MMPPTRVMSVISLWGMPIVEPDPDGGDQRATRSAVELATWETRRSTVMAWLSSTAPMNMMAMIGTIMANSTAATPSLSACQRRRSSPTRATRSFMGRGDMVLSIVGIAVGSLGVLWKRQLKGSERKATDACMSSEPSLRLPILKNGSLPPDSQA